MIYTDVNEFGFFCRMLAGSWLDWYKGISGDDSSF